MKNPEFHAKSKHIDISLHHVREAAENREVNPTWISTTDQLADCLTKPLTKKILRRHIEGMGMRVDKAQKVDAVDNGGESR